LINAFVPIKDYLKTYSKDIKLCGGVLSDTVGLGKTASLICHIANSLEKDKIKYDIYKSNLSKFGLEVNDNDNDDAQFKDPLVNGGFEYNNLIIVPSRLTSQWEQEIAKYLEGKFKLRVKVLVSISNIKTLEKELKAFNAKLSERKLLQEKTAKAEAKAEAKLSAKVKAKPTITKKTQSDTGDKPKAKPKGRPTKASRAAAALEALMKTDLGDDKLLIETVTETVTDTILTAQETEQETAPALDTSTNTLTTPKSYDLEQLYDVYIVSLNLLSNENYIAHIGLKEGDHLISDAKIEAKALEYMTTVTLNKLMVEDSETGKPNYKEQLERAKTMYRLDAVRKQFSSPWTITRDMDKFNIFKSKWNRATLDEAHEKLQPPIKLLHSEQHNHIYKTDDQYIYECLVNLQSNYKWGLSGTPLEAGCRNLAGIIQFLSVKSPLTSKQSQIYNTRYLTDIIGIQKHNIDVLLKTIVKQTTKKEVKNIINIPIFTETIIYIDQTNIERNIYNTIRCSTHFTDETKRKRLFLMCTNILINEGYDLTNKNEIISDTILTLEELNANMIGKFKTQLKTVNGELARLETQQSHLATDNEHLTAINTYIADRFSDSKNMQKLLTSYISAATSSYTATSAFAFTPALTFDKLIKEIDNRMALFETRTAHSDQCRVILSVIQIYELWSQLETLGSKLFINLDIIKEALYLPSQTDYPHWQTPIGLEYSAQWAAKYGVKQNNNDIIKNQKRIDTNKNEQKRLNNQIVLFKDNEFLKEKTSDPCIICFEELNEIAITPCRHIFCKECCNRLSDGFKIGFNCPECRGGVMLSDINMTNIEYINDPNKKKPVAKDGDGDSNTNTCDDGDGNDDGDGDGTDGSKPKQVSQLVTKLGRKWKTTCINKYGSKMAVLVEYLYKLFENIENRVIIFSQYDKMLKMIGKTLEEFAIKFVYCSGNTYVVNKNINKFKKDDSIRVIMLSSETSNSGSNLTEANHIIFIDVLFQDKQHVQSVEQQAIGRAVRLGQKRAVNVVRFVTRGTVEQEHFDKNKYDINKLQE